MTVNNRPNVSLLAALAALSAGLFVLDLLVPEGMAIRLPYATVVLLSLWLPRRRATYLAAAACTALIGLGLVLSPADGFFWTSLLNRLLAVVVIWVAAILGLAARRTGQLEEANAHLQREIAERTRAEERLREQASLLDLAQDAILVHDLDDRILFWNEGARRLYGWTAAEACGRSAGELLGQSGPPAGADVRTILLQRGQWAGEFRQTTRDGRVIVVEARSTLMRDAAGRPRSILVVNTDVTEKRKLETQLLRTQRLESLGVLAGGIAHDFNNLLTPLLLAVKLLKEDPPEEDRRALLTTLQASAERGADLVRQLLSFAGGGDGRRAAVQVAHLLREVKAILDHTFPKAIQVQVSAAADLGAVCADETQLAQVLMNLCVNARDAMPQGGTLAMTAENIVVEQGPLLETEEARPGPYVLITVADTGVGIPPDVFDRIFDPFFTTKGPGKGTGLGLSTVLGIVRHHGGFLRVVSEVDEGTSFAVYLPRLTDASTEGKACGEEPETPAGHGELILVVDDESAILETAGATLRRRAFRVLTAADGVEALAVYRQRHHDVQAVLLDLVMPGLDGATVLAGLREVNPQVRVIASSGLRLTGRLASAAAAATTFLPKPYTESQLLAAVTTGLHAPGE